MATILIAEDDPAVREFVSRALVHMGHDVTAVDDGYQALQMMSDGGYDLLITDVKMPGVDGIELSQQVVRNRPNLPVLIMTGYAEECHRLEVQSGRVTKLITKPFTLKEICAAAAEALAA